MRINFKLNFTSQPLINEITTTIEIIISIVVENAFQTKHHIATTNEITTTIEMIFSIVVATDHSLFPFYKQKKKNCTQFCNALNITKY